MFDNTKQKMWYEEQVASSKKATQPVPDQLLIELKDEAKKCHDADVANYNIKNSKTNANFQWMKTVMSKGALSDKIAAYTVVIQDSPVHSLETLSNLLGMVKVGKKKDCLLVIENLVELFLGNLLPPNRKLIPFRERPLTALNDLSSGNAITRKKYLSVWYFEDQLKEVYALFVAALNTVARDTVDNNKEKALIAMNKLLAGHPEQEKNLLMHIINKLGDPSRAVASKAIYCLTKLLHQHSNMQGVVLGETEKLLFRPNISSKAQYYALCFLTQFYLCHEASDIARRLIEVYFSFFKACVKKGEVNSRIMSALLMGVNRAYPYAKLEIAKISSHIDTMYRVVHIAQFNVSLHALALLYQISSHSDQVSDRFFVALYKKLLDPQMSNSTHHAMLLSLVYKALSSDNRVDRTKVLIKRLLQIAIYAHPPMACGILYVVSQLINKKPELSALVLKPSLFCTKEEEEGDDNEEEKYADVKDDDDDDETEGQIEESSEHLEGDISSIATRSGDDKVVAGWVHNSNTNAKSANKTIDKFDCYSRNPLYAGGQFCAYTELNVLKCHFHPSVSLFADNLLNEKPIQYTGDPLKDFSLIRFLDRFAFKNPKRPEELAKSGHHPTFGKRKNYRPTGTRSLSVKSTSYLNEQESKIPVDELFLYTFLQRRGKERRKEDDEESDLESVNSEEFEDMLDKMGGVKDLDDDVDYMDEVEGNLKPKKKKKNKGDAEDDDMEGNGDDFEEEDNVDMDDDDELADIDDEEEFNEDEMNDDDKELIGLSDDDNESDIVFDSEEEMEPNTKSKKKGKNDVASLFASADEFASLLEDEGSSKLAPGSSQAWSNKDNANMHQIAWEDKRNHWLKGYKKTMQKGDKRTDKNFKSNNSKRKWANKDKKSHNKKKKFK